MQIFDIVVLIISFFIYYITPIWIVINKRKDVWKGICGGNGIPQPTELVRGITMLGIWIEYGRVLFFNTDLDIAFLGLLLGVLGISSFAPHKEMKGH